MGHILGATPRTRGRGPGCDHDGYVSVRLRLRGRRKRARACLIGQQPRRERHPIVFVSTDDVIRRPIRERIARS